ASPVARVELRERRTDPRSTPPVDGDLVRSCERRLRIAGRELGREPGETRAEREGLDAVARADDGVEIEQQRSGVRVHRAGDVAEHDELPWDHLPRLPRLLDRLPARAE